jgi:hypothetical protein
MEALVSFLPARRRPIPAARAGSLLLCGLACAATSGCGLYGAAYNPGAYDPNAARARAIGAVRDPSFDRSSTDLEQTIARETTGFTVEGEPRTGSLESFAPLPIPLVRGKCYVVVLRLGPSAMWGDSARHGVAFGFFDDAGDTGGARGGRIVGPGGVGLVCPLRDTPGTTIDVRAVLAAQADPSKIHDLGSGPFTLQVYSRPAGEAELGAMAQRRAQEADAAQRRQAAGPVCERKYFQCRDDAHGNLNAMLRCDKEKSDCISDAGR